MDPVTEVSTIVSHGDPIAPVIFSVTLILVSALLGRFGARRLKQPSVLGELVMGVLLGNLLYFLGFDLMAILVPIFFVLMGIQVKLETFLDWHVLLLSTGLILVAIIGKIVSGLGVLEKGRKRLAVGIGMLPRGEVGLVFASIGISLKVIDSATFSAAVLMVIVTTLVTPPLLKITLGQGGQATGSRKISKMCE
ncbi:MAG: cation:proton antiporter [gamma proteobacterium endosymbiont of Lamellibrachia anaximandri]|nr:cation:proton antiporter [gamma proteobacterium endosymbiont of Lamellibrachia anaximandri]